MAAPDCWKHKYSGVRKIQTNETSICPNLVTYYVAMTNASFQIDKDRLQEFDRKIKEKQIEGELPSDASRSDVLREMVADYVENDDCGEATAH